MQPTLVWRHRRENLKKCSLRGLESRPDFQFFTYPSMALPDTTNYILLTLDGTPLTPEDRTHGLILIDGTWRYASKMLQALDHRPNILRRSIPGSFRTAYPRCQTSCADPERGLASLEAIFVAYHVLGHDTTGLLDNYHWKQKFLELNASSLGLTTGSIGRML